MNWWCIVDNKIAKNFAQTYTDIGARDGWDRVQEYRRVAEYIANHPSKGSSSVASALETSRSRIRAWVDKDGRPDPVRGLEIAADNNWLSRNWDDPTSQAMNILVAWIFSGGSISSNTYQPRFVVESTTDADTVSSALNTIGITGRQQRKTSSNRGSEIVPAEDASILGRILTAWGAPVGNKNEQKPLSLPDYLTDSPHDICGDFARVYMTNRAVIRTNWRNQLQIREKRSRSYRQELANLFKTACPDSVEIVSAGNDLIYIHTNSPHELTQHPNVAD
jgi:hypothetical protein